MTKTIFKTIVAVLAAAMVFSCEKPPVPELSLSDKAANFNASGELSKTIQVTANYAWTATKSADWITLDKTAGESNGSFTITVSENKSFEVREGTVTVTSEGLTETVTVKQISPEPSLVVSEDLYEVPAAGGTVQIAVTSNVAWTVEVVVDWVTVDKTSGENNGVINVTVQENKSVDSRGVVIAIDGKGQNVSKIVELKQLGAEPVLSVSPDTVSDMSAEGGTVQIAVTSNMAWSVNIVTDWVTADKLSGENDGVINLQVQKNINPMGRGVVISVENNTYNVSDLVELTQLAAPLSRQTDSLALVAIYNASKGATWKADKVWDLSKSIDNWSSVTVDKTSGRVTALKITAASTITETWTLPEEVGYLSEVNDFRINSQKLTGEIPESFYKLTNLKNLYLQNNDLTGALSPSITNFTLLESLYIDRNTNLSGSLPSNIGSMTKLKNINISQTSIGGSIPADLANCSSLANLMAYSNKLSGEIPDIWDKLPNMTVIQLYGNPGITGPIPATMGTLKKATGIQLKECNLTGNIPASFGGLEKCGNLQLNGNKLKGVVPAEVQAHANWKNDKWKVATNILPQQEGYGLTTE